MILTFGLLFGNVTSKKVKSRVFGFSKSENVFSNYGHCFMQWSRPFQTGRTQHMVYATDRLTLAVTQMMITTMMNNMMKRRPSPSSATYSGGNARKSS